jgi:hypothetical protein
MIEMNMPLLRTHSLRANPEMVGAWQPSFIVWFSINKSARM